MNCGCAVSKKVGVLCIVRGWKGWRAMKLGGRWEGEGGFEGGVGGGDWGWWEGFVLWKGAVQINVNNNSGANWTWGLLSAETVSPLPIPPHTLHLL